MFKKTVTRWVDPATGKRCPSGTPGAEKRESKSRKWYAKVKGADGTARVVPLAADKAAARVLLRELEVGADRERAGLTTAAAERAARVPLARHLDDYADHLAGRGNTARYVKEERRRIERVLNGTGATLPADLAAGAVTLWLAGERDRGAFGPKTSNHILAACKGFTGWLVKDGRASADPLTHADRVKLNGDVRRVRRDAAPAEVAAVVAAAAAGPVRFGLPGPDRAVLYEVAAATGLRASELASVTAAAFDLAADPPTLAVAADRTKNGKRAVQPLPAAVAARVRAWLADRDDAPDAPLWPGRWAGDRKAAPMLRGDLDAAGIDPGDPRAGVLDFHALRHTYISRVADTGAAPAVVQRLARHADPRMTFGRYVHPDRDAAAAAVAALPVGPSPSAPAEVPAVTPGGGVVAPMVAPAGRDGAGPGGTPRDGNPGADAARGGPRRGSGSLEKQTPRAAPGRRGSPRDGGGKKGDVPDSNRRPPGPQPGALTN